MGGGEEKKWQQKSRINDVCVKPSGMDQYTRQGLLMRSTNYENADCIYLIRVERAFPLYQDTTSFTNSMCTPYRCLKGNVFLRKERQVKKKKKTKKTTNVHRIFAALSVLDW